MEKPFSDIPNLPPDRDKFWDGADKHSIEVKENKCDHYFIRKGYSVECRKCFIGFLLNYPFYIADGSICLGEEFII